MDVKHWRMKIGGEVQKIVAEDVPAVRCKTNIAVTPPNISGIRLSAQADFLALKDP